MTTWKLDASHSQISFIVRHLVISKVRGTFASWSGAIEVDDKDRTKSKVHVEVDLKSVTTNDEKRDGHMRSADFFDVEKHPTMTFDSTKVVVEGGKITSLTGNLTIRGITKPLTLSVEDLGTAKDPWGGTRAGFSAKGRIARSDFGLVWNVPLEAGGVLVAENVDIEIEAQAVAS